MNAAVLLEVRILKKIVCHSKVVCRRFHCEMPICRELAQQLAAMSKQESGCQRQLQTGNIELAEANLSRESELADLRNQIAMIRYIVQPPLHRMMYCWFGKYNAHGSPVSDNGSSCRLLHAGCDTEVCRYRHVAKG